MQSLLENLRSEHRNTRLVEYQKEIANCPPVSKLLIAHLEKMFSPPQLKPTRETMSQELVYQHGIDRVIKYLQTVNERQESEIRNERIKND